MVNKKRLLTVIKYSTARSGLLKLARRARCTSSRGKPISTIFWIEVCNASPLKNELPSPPVAGGEASVVTGGVGAATGWGGGVATTGGCTGAGAGAGAGVELDEAAGVAFG